MHSVPTFDYARSDVSRVYAAARALPDHALDEWRNAIIGIAGATRHPIRTILDAGCGTGRFSALLAEIFSARVLGIDPAPNMLEVARGNVADPRCSFTAGALEALPADDASIDVVFLSMVYHHVRDWPAAHREINRVLRPGGIVLVRTALRENLSDYLWSRFFPRALALDQKRLPSADDIVAELAQGGFSLVRHRAVEHRFSDDAPSYLAKIRLRGLSGLRLISDAEFEAGVEKLDQHLRLAPSDPRMFTEAMDLFCFAQTASPTSS